MQKNPGVKKSQKNDKFCLYGMLELQNSKATKEQIRKQYRKLVMIYHPDKNKDDPQTKEKFQRLKQAYDILINDEKRKQYDQTGSVGQFNQDSFQSAYQYFRTLYRKINQQDIQHYQQKYKLSSQEQQDLINFYNREKGDMTNLLQAIPFSQQQDIGRFIEYYIEKRADQTIKKYKKFETTKDHIKPLPNEEKQFNQIQQNKKKEQMKQLVLAIQNKTNNNFLDHLQQKYGPKKVNKVKKESKLSKQK